MQYTYNDSSIHYSATGHCSARPRGTMDIYNGAIVHTHRSVVEVIAHAKQPKVGPAWQMGSNQRVYGLVELAVVDSRHLHHYEEPFYNRRLVCIFLYLHIHILFKHVVAGTFVFGVARLMSASNNAVPRRWLTICHPMGVAAYSTFNGMHASYARYTKRKIGRIGLKLVSVCTAKFCRAFHSFLETI